MPPKKANKQRKDASKLSVAARSQSSQNTSNDNDETNENESLNQEEASIINRQ